MAWQIVHSIISILCWARFSSQRTSWFGSAWQVYPPGDPLNLHFDPTQPPRDGSPQVGCIHSLAAAMCQCYPTVCLQLWQNNADYVFHNYWTASNHRQLRKTRGRKAPKTGWTKQSKVAGTAQVCLSVAVHEDLLATVAEGLSSALWMWNVSHIQ